MIVNILILYGDVSPQFQEKGELSRGIAPTKNEANVDDELFYSNVDKRVEYVGVISTVMKGRVDVILVEKDILPGMRNRQVPNVSLVTQLIRSIEGWWTLDGI